MSESFLAPALGAAAAGFLGSLHCVGMCGPLALALGGAGGEHAAGRMARLLLGKSTTYVLLGLFAGLVGSGIGSASVGSDLQAMVALVAGVVMVVLGLENQGIGAGDRSGTGARPGAVSSLLVRLLRSGDGRAPFFGGMLVGLLPCGLVYAMVAQALATGSILGGGLVMTGFAVGTAPALAATSWLGSRIQGHWRQTGERLAAGAVVLMGVVSIYRGGSALWSVSSGTAMHCH